MKRNVLYIPLHFSNQCYYFSFSSFLCEVCCLTLLSSSSSSFSLEYQEGFPLELYNVKKHFFSMRVNISNSLLTMDVV